MRLNEDITLPTPAFTTALYGGVESGKEYNTVDMSRVRMMNQ